MSGHYSEINLHIVWHTKESEPMLTPEIEAFVHRNIRERIVQTRGVIFHEINGIENHVHVAVSIPPTLRISEFIGQLKGASSHEANKYLGKGNPILEWQGGYGVVSFGTKDLEWVKAYIRNQREHHSKGTLQPRLERVDSEEESPQRSGDTALP